MKQTITQPQAPDLSFLNQQTSRKNTINLLNSALVFATKCLVNGNLKIGLNIFTDQRLQQYSYLIKEIAHTDESIRRNLTFFVIAQVIYMALG